MSAATRQETAPLGTPDAPAPLWAISAITFLNSVGSGLLWSGLYFVTEHDFGYRPSENFLLALASTVVYAAVAFGSGPALRKLAPIISPRRAMVIILTVQLIAGLLTLLAQAGLLICAMLTSAAGAALWPMMESYLTSGRHGHGMRRAIGIFNVTWMSATGLALLVIAPAMASEHAALGLLLLTPISVLSLLLLPWLPSAPAPHAPEERHRHVPPVYTRLRDATRYLLPVGYIFIGSIGPAIPFILERLHVDSVHKTPITAIWMGTRVLTVLLLISLRFWHGRWWTLALGFSCAAGGFAIIALAPSLPVMIVGLSLFGAGEAIVYYAALYYAMAVGGADMHAGAIFETLVGLGYGVGPIAGLICGAGSSYVWAVLLTGCVCALPALRIALRRSPDGAAAAPALR